MVYCTKHQTPNCLIIKQEDMISLERAVVLGDWFIDDCGKDIFYKLKEYILYKN
jgi:hypothetical protein